VFGIFANRFSINVTNDGSFLLRNLLFASARARAPTEF